MFRRHDPTKHWPKKFNEFSYPAFTRDDRDEHRKQAIKADLGFSPWTRITSFDRLRDEPKLRSADSTPCNFTRACAL
jgi:hypothetical protein